MVFAAMSFIQTSGSATVRGFTLPWGFSFGARAVLVD